MPVAGEPIAVIPEIAASTMAATWIADIRTWPAPVPEDDGQSLLSGVVKTLPRRFARIGAELGREMALRMPVIEFLALRERCAGIDIADGSPCLWTSG